MPEEDLRLQSMNIVLPARLWRLLGGMLLALNYHRVLNNEAPIDLSHLAGTLLEQFLVEHQEEIVGRYEVAREDAARVYAARHLASFLPELSGDDAEAAANLRRDADKYTGRSYIVDALVRGPDRGSPKPSTRLYRASRGLRARALTRSSSAHTQEQNDCGPDAGGKQSPEPGYRDLCLAFRHLEALCERTAHHVYPPEVRRRG